MILDSPKLGRTLSKEVTTCACFLVQTIVSVVRAQLGGVHARRSALTARVIPAHGIDSSTHVILSRSLGMAVANQIQAISRSAAGLFVKKRSVLGITIASLVSDPRSPFFFHRSELGSLTDFTTGPEMNHFSTHVTLIDWLFFY